MDTYPIVEICVCVCGKWEKRWTPVNGGICSESITFIYHIEMPHLTIYGERGWSEKSPHYIEREHNVIPYHKSWESNVRLKSQIPYYRLDLPNCSPNFPTIIFKGGEWSCHLKLYVSTNSSFISPTIVCPVQVGKKKETEIFGKYLIIMRTTIH